MVSWKLFLCLAGMTLIPEGRAQNQKADERIKNSLVTELVEGILKAHGGIRNISLIAYDSGDTLTKHYTFGHQRAVENTAFIPPHCVGGITQGLTAILLQKLLSLSNHTWSTPIQDILGHQLILPDKYRSDNLNLRDILAMRSGLAGMDIVPVVGAFQKNQLLRQLRYLREDSGFRSQFVHNTILYSLVDAVVEKMTGLSFEDAMMKYLLKPLGMESGQFFWNVPNNGHKQLSYSDIISSSNTLCLKDYTINKLFHELTIMSIDNEQANFLNADQLNELFQGIQSRGVGDPTIQGYKQTTNTMAMTREHNGLGWIVGRVGPNRAVSLGGSFVKHDQSLLTYLPDRHIGVFVSFQGTGRSDDFAAKFMLTEGLMRLELNNYRPNRMVRRNDSVVKDSFNSMKTFPPLTRDSFQDKDCVYNRNCDVQRPLDEYAGVYKNYAFGDIKVAFNESGDERLLLEYGDAVYSLRPVYVANDTFKLKPLEGDFYTTFAFLYNVPMQAKFMAAEDDRENRIFTVTMTGVDRYVDPEFSLNPREPSYEGREAARCGGSGEDGAEGERCSACGFVVSFWCLALALLAIRV